MISFFVFDTRNFLFILIIYVMKEVIVMDYRLVDAKLKDIELLTSIKLITMIDDDLDKKLSHDEREKIKDNIEETLRKDYHNYKIIYIESNIAGVYALIPYLDGLMLDEIYLFKEYRDNGIGTRLINKMKFQTTKLYVWAYKNNKKFLSLLDRLGFEIEKNKRTIILSYDSIVKGVAEKMATIKHGYRDKFGKVYINFSPNFRLNYYLQSSKEVEANGYGICFDQVEYERTLFKELGLEFRTYFIYYSSLSNDAAHSFLVFKNNEKYYWFENAWLKYKGIHEYDSKEELFSDVIKKFGAAHEIDKLEKIRLYSFDKPKAGMNYFRYTKFCTSGTAIKI